jgi:hypothetical protein
VFRIDIYIVVADIISNYISIEGLEVVACYAGKYRMFPAIPSNKGIIVLLNNSGIKVLIKGYKDLIIYI